MTTVAFGLDSVASDSRRCCGSELIDETTEKIAVRYGVIYAFTGVYAFREAAIQWYQNGATPGDQPKGDKDTTWSLYAYDNGKLYRTAWDLPYREELPLPQAFGSGQPYAQAALLLGKSAKEAIEVAKRLDIYTGGPVQVIEYASIRPKLEAAE